MRSIFLLLSLIPLCLCSCDDDIREERERESRIDAEAFGCRSCRGISVSADEGCAKGYECDANLEMTSNVLKPNDCACSEIKCKDPSATLVVDGTPVIKIRCKDQEWIDDSSNAVTSAVCAKRCGRGVCKLSHRNADMGSYSPLQPNDAENCASAECSNGFAVLSANGVFSRNEDVPSIVCSSSGKWRVGDSQEEFVMCKKKAGCLQLTELSKQELDSEYPDSFTHGKATITAEAAFCPSGTGPLFAFKDRDGIVPISGATMTCTNGEWEVIIGGSPVKLKDQFGVDNTQVCCASPNA